MSYAVVLFEETDDISVVPVLWLKGKTCAWPIRKKDIGKLIENQIVPDADWEYYSARILGVYETYQEAKRHERKAEDTSNIDSDLEMLGRGQRFQKKLRKNKRKRESESSSDDNSRLEFPNVPETYSFDVEQVTAAPNDSYVVLSNNIPTSQTEDHPKNKEQDNVYNRLLREILHVKLTLREHGESLQCIMQSVNTLLEHSSKLPKEGTVSKEYSWPVSLPLSSLEDLWILEEYLGNDENCQHMVSYVSQIGGFNIGNVVRRTLSKLMTNDVAIQFSWLGAKEKRPFINLKISKIIFSAVRKNKLFKDCDDSTIERVVKDWLRHAKQT